MYENRISRAARTVTGSKHLCPTEKLLLDCGISRGMGSLTDGLDRDFGFDPSSINYMILSHAHYRSLRPHAKLISDGYNE